MVERIHNSLPGLRKGGALLPLLIVLLPLLGGEALSQRLAPSALKAGFVNNLLKYSRWPDSAFEDKGKKKAPIILGVMGDDDVAKVLEKLTKKGLNGRAIDIRKIDTSSATQGFHLIYTASQDSGVLSALVRKTRNQPVVLVSSAESLDALALGIDVNLLPKKLRKGKKLVLRILLEVNLKSLKKRKLSIHSSVLRLARRVVK